MSSLYGSFFCFRYWETMGLICKGKGRDTSVRDVLAFVQGSQPEASPSSLQGAQKTRPTCPKQGWRRQRQL